MARTLVQALEGLTFPCDRARIVEYASRNDIAPRAMDFLQKLPEQQYASMAELFTALPSKGSMRKPRPRLTVVEPPEHLPADEHEEPAVQRAQDQDVDEQQDQPPLDEEAEAEAAIVDDDDEQDRGEGYGQEQEDEPQGNRPAEPAAAREPATQGMRNEPAHPPAGDQGHDWRPLNPAAATTRMDPFGVTGQWQRLWLDWYSKSAESYTRLFMPWLRR